MKNRDIIELLEKLAPKELACGWDNTGLQAGSLETEFTGVYIALDATPETVQDAIGKGCSLLVTHHPLLFSPVSSVTDQTVTGRMILAMIRAGLSCYSMHTSYDKTVGGMADAAAKRLGLTDCIPLEEAGEDGSGIGRVGRLSFGRPVNVREFARFVKDAFDIPAAALYTKDEKQIITKAAILPGSGKSEWTLAMDAGAEVYVTGDMNYHTALDAVNAGITVIDAGHDGIEKLFTEEIRDYLLNNIHNNDLIYTQKWVSISKYI